MKILFLIITICLIFLSCSKEENPPEGKNLVFYSYYHYDEGKYPYSRSYPTSSCKIIAADLYFFKAEDIKSDIQKEVIVIKDYMDFPKIHSEVISLLENESKLKLEDGTMIKPITIDLRIYDKIKPAEFSFYSSTRAFTSIDYEDEDNFDELSKNEISLKPGRYFVVAICRGYNLPYGYYYSDKYSGKFITISPDMPIEDHYIKIVFPYDPNYKGYFDWIDGTWDWE